MPVAFIMPKIDMDQEKATIVSWEKSEGDYVNADETVLIVETDKVAIDIPAPASGILTAIRFKPGDVVPVTEVIAYILQDGEKKSELPADNPIAGDQNGSYQRDNIDLDQQKIVQQAKTLIDVSASPVAQRMAKEHKIDLMLVPKRGDRITRDDIERYIETQSTSSEDSTRQNLSGIVRATPAARRLARERGISLEAISGSGPLGRVQAADLVTANQGSLESKVNPGKTPANEIDLTGMRRTIADRMQVSFREIPHISLTIEVDISAIERICANLNKISESEKTGRVTLTGLLVKIVAWALERHPEINASFVNDKIYLWKEINIGIATALEDGLIVPVIHQANMKSVRQIADAIQDLTTRARQGQLTLNDVHHGTFTISNLGMFQINYFTAIINPPEAAILAIGKSVRKPVVINENDDVEIRPIITMTLSGDHRLVDGVTAARFLSDLAKAIEMPELLNY